MKPLGLLEWVLVIKIVMTVVWVALLLASEWLFGWVGIPKPEPMIFVILLAGAYIALLVGYVLGFLDHKQGKNIRNVVVVGIVSNGWAAFFLLLFGLAGAWNIWSGIAQGFMWFSAVMAGLITIGLVITLPAPSDSTLAT